MAVYANAEQVKAVYTKLFDTVATTDPDGMDSLVKAKMIIHFACLIRRSICGLMAVPNRSWPVLKIRV